MEPTASLWAFLKKENAMSFRRLPAAAPAAVLTLLLVLPAVAAGQTIFVPAQADLQTAINQVANGGVIEIAAGSDTTEVVLR